MKERKWYHKLQLWWQSDCAICLKTRRLLLWLLLMLLADYFWFHLLFK